jgi:hypothetical protein
MGLAQVEKSFFPLGWRLRFCLAGDSPNCFQ